MKLRLAAAVALVVLAGIFLWWGNRSGTAGRETGAARETKSDNGNSAVISASGAEAIRTKASHREKTLTLATHSPRQLKDFVLPDLVLDGLTLEQAVRKLFASYEDTCRLTGETPLPMKFEIPAGNQRLRLRLKSESLRTSLRLLAALAGMKVTRDELTWRFKPFAGEDRVSRTVDTNAGFTSKLWDLASLTKLAGDPFTPFPPVEIRQALTDVGFDLNPASEISVSPDGKLTLKNIAATDASRIVALARAISEIPPLQQKFNTKLIELPAEIELPDTAAMTEGQVQGLMRTLAQKRGVELMVAPSVMARNEQPTKIEMTKEFIYPDDGADGGFEKKNIGQVISVNGRMLGLGQEFDFHYTDTQVDMSGGTPVFPVRSDVALKGFSPNGNTMGRIQERADGSRVLVLVTSQRIDATGRPVDFTR